MRLPRWGQWAVLVLVGVALLLASACARGNNPPLITSVSADPTNMAPGEISTLTCVASDPDGDTLTYSWKYSGPCEAAIPGTSSTVDWTVAGALGTYTVTVTVDDGRGGTDEGSCYVTVAVAVTVGSIDVKSSPAGATVYIDGTDTGNISPYVITSVNEGEHTIKLAKEFCKDREETVIVTAGETTYVNWELDAAPPQTVTIQPSAAEGKDAAVSSLYPNVKYGTHEYLCAGADLMDEICRSYLQFDLSEIPTTAVATDAQLGLYYDDTYGTEATPIGAYEVISSWEEGTIMWNDKPTSAATPVDTCTVPASPTNAFIYWHVYDLVKGWIDGSITNYGVMLRDNEEITEEAEKLFYSSDYTADPTKHPKLVITYYDPAP